MTVEIKTLPTLDDVELQLKAVFGAAVDNLKTIAYAFDNEAGADLLGKLDYWERHDKYYMTCPAILRKMALDSVRIQKNAEKDGISMQIVFDGVQPMLSNLAGDPSENDTQGTHAAKKYLKEFLQAARDVYGKHDEKAKVEIDEFITEMDAAFDC